MSGTDMKNGVSLLSWDTLAFLGPQAEGRERIAAAIALRKQETSFLMPSLSHPLPLPGSPFPSYASSQ